MASVKFYLKNRQAKRETSIYMTLRYGAYACEGRHKKYTPFKYYVGESIAPRFWNPQSCRAKTSQKTELHAELNRWLSHLEYTAQCALLRLKNSGAQVTNNSLRHALAKALGKNNFSQKEATLLAFAERYVDEVRSVKSTGTVRQYENTLRLLRAFCAKTKKDALSFEDIDLNFYAQFRAYMYGLGLSDTYFGNQIKFIRLFMNEATERGYNTQVRYKSKKFSSIAEVPHKVYLSEEEISRLRALNLSSEPLLEKISDLFFVACKTGLRFSDLQRIGENSFSADGKILCITTQKTGTRVYIPLSAEVQQVCRKHRYILPRVSNQHFNKQLKKLAQMANIAQEVEVAAQEKCATYKKYELVSSHTARRSFATNAYLAGIPTIAIMRITGHATERAFMQYIRVASEDNANNLLQHPYFE